MNRAPRVHCSAWLAYGKRVLFGRSYRQCDDPGRSRPRDRHRRMNRQRGYDPIVALSVLCLTTENGTQFDAEMISFGAKITMLPTAYAHSN